MDFKRLFATSLSIALITTLSPVGSFAQESSTRTPSTKNAQAESEILSMQKDGVQAIRKMLTVYQKSGLKETGKMSIVVKVDSTDYKIGVDFKIDEYASISNLLKGDASFDARGSLNVSSTINTRDYTATPDEEYNYPKKTEVTLFAINFAGEIKLVDKKAYFTLKQLDLAPGAVLKDAVDLADMIEKAQKEVVGKTFQLPASEMNFTDSASYLARLEKALQVLEYNSLLEVASRNGNTSIMRLKRSTVQAVNLALGNKKNAGMLELGSLTPKNGVLSLSQNGATTKLAFIKGKQGSKASNNSMVLTKKDGAYRLDMQTQEGNKKNGSKMSMSMEANRMVMGAVNWSSYSYSDVAVLWENGNFNLKSVTTPMPNSYGTASNFEINGPLDIWGANANLTLFVDGTRYGNLALSTSGNRYSLALTGDYAQDGTSVSLKMLVEAMLESGDYTISAPEKFETVESLNF
jgi:hypothetical protein